MNIPRLLNLVDKDKLSFCDPVAQVVEQRPFKADVEGSSPSWVTFLLLPLSFHSNLVVIYYQVYIF